MLSLKLFFMRAKDRVNLIVLTVALFIVSQTMQYCIGCAMFLSEGKQRPFGPFANK